MTTPYAQSLRSVYDNGFWPWVIGIAITLVLIVIWGLWFMLARVALYVTSTTVEPAGDFHVIAHFPPEDIARILPGEDATLQLNSQSTEQATLSVPARVLDVYSPAADQPGQAELELLPARTGFSTAQVVSAVSRQVTIQVEKVSPLELTLRALGKATDSP
jgi:hypothetical protein